MTKRNGKLGFTTLELMVTVCILTVLVAIAVPAISSWLPNYRLKAAARDLFSNMQRARLEAVKLNCYVTITFNLPLGGTTYDYVGYVDQDRDLEYDTGEQILFKVKYSDYKGVLSGGNTFSNNDNGRPSVAFNSKGLPINNSGGFGSGSVTLTNTKARVHTVALRSAGGIKLT